MIRRIPRGSVPEPLDSPQEKTPRPAEPSEGAPAGKVESAALARALTLLLGEELLLRPEHIAQVLSRELLRVRRARQIVARVNPEDLSLLRAPEHYVAALELEGALTLVPDPTLTRWGAVLCSELGEIDAQLETRLGLMLALLESGALW